MLLQLGAQSCSSPRALTSWASWRGPRGCESCCPLWSTAAAAPTKGTECWQLQIAFIAFCFNSTCQHRNGSCSFSIDIYGDGPHADQIKEHARTVATQLNVCSWPHAEYVDYFVKLLLTDAGVVPRCCGPRAAERVPGLCEPLGQRGAVHGHRRGPRHGPVGGVPAAPQQRVLPALPQLPRVPQTR